MIIRFKGKFSGKEILDAFYLAFRSHPTQNCRWTVNETVTNFDLDMADCRNFNYSPRTVILSSHLEFFCRPGLFCSKKWVNDGLVTIVAQEIDLLAQYSEIKIEFRTACNFTESEIFDFDVRPIFQLRWEEFLKMSEGFCLALRKQANNS